MSKLDKTTLLSYLLGYLTPEQWIDAYRNADGVHFTKEQVRVYALDVDETYGGTVFSKEQLKKLGVRNP